MTKLASKKIKINKLSHEWLPIVAVLVLALLQRLILYTGVLDYDVLNYANLAHNAAIGQIRFDLDWHSIIFRYGLYLPVALFYKIFGPSEFTTILYPLLISIAGVLGIYGIGHIVENQRVGLLGALIWATFPMNVFLSTLFGPDSILSNFIIFSTFFLFLGEKSSGRRRVLSYLAALILLAAAVTVKPSAFIGFVFVGIYSLWKIWQNQAVSITKKWKKQSAHRKRWIIIFFLALIFTGLLVFIRQGSFPLLHLLFLASSDLSNLFVLGKTEEYFPIVGHIFTTNLFLVAAPLFIMAFAVLVRKTIKGRGLVLAWAASQFVYFEWGSLSTNPLHYAPFVGAVNDRNVLFIFAPFAVLSGIYLSKLFSQKQLNKLIVLLCLVLFLITWLTKQSGFEGPVIYILSAGVFLAVLCVIVSPFFIPRNPRTRVVFGGIFVSTLLLAFLYPTPPLHISGGFWQQQVRYRTTIRQAAEFFQNGAPFPVIALSNSNAQELNFASNFALGQVGDPILIPPKGARIHVLSDPRATEESSYIYLRDEINHFHITPPNWWRIAQFDAGASEPIVIFRVLSKTDANAELVAALASLKEAPSEANYARVLAAGVNAQDASAVVLAWTQLARLAPDDYPVTLAAPTLISESVLGNIAHSVNLLPDDLHQFEIDQGLKQTSDPEKNTLTLKILDDSPRSSSVHSRLRLQPNSAYVFFLDVMSDTGVDVLSIPDVSDSHNYSDTYGEWQTVRVAFITPQWPSEREVQFDLVLLHKAGSVSLRNPQLYLLQTDEHE